MTNITVIAEHTIYDNIGANFIVSDTIDPNTGEFKLVTQPRITQPGEWVTLPEETARELLECGAAREPTANELTLRAYATMEANDDIG